MIEGVFLAYLVGGRKGRGISKDVLGDVCRDGYLGGGDKGDVFLFNETPM
jgi:hypothetical protein